jgi:hypothetical protein
MKNATERKQRNVAAHSKNAPLPKGERKKHIVTQEE